MPISELFRNLNLSFVILINLLMGSDCGCHFLLYIIWLNIASGNSEVLGGKWFFRKDLYLLLLGTIWGPPNKNYFKTTY